MNTPRPDPADALPGAVPAPVPPAAVDAEPSGPSAAPATGPAPSRRRHWLLGATALLAGAGGLAWSLRRQQAAAAAAPSGAEAAFFQLSFPAPAPDQPAVQAAAFRGRPLLLNFWATWCPPCIKELPEIDRFHRSMAPRGWQVLGLAVDAPTPVRAFLQRQPLGFPVALAGLEGTELSRSLGNERGALPFTVLFDAGGRVVRRKLGETTHDELQGWARDLGA